MPDEAIAWLVAIRGGGKVERKLGVRLIERRRPVGRRRPAAARRSYKKKQERCRSKSGGHMRAHNAVLSKTRTRARANRNAINTSAAAAIRALKCAPFVSFICSDSFDCPSARAFVLSPTPSAKAEDAFKLPLAVTNNFG